MSKTSQEGWVNKPAVKIAIEDVPRVSQLPAVQLKISDFDQMIYNNGIRIKVYRTTYCANVKSLDGSEHEIDCTICGGGGFIDRSPLATWGHLHSQGLGKNKQPEGYIEENQVKATFLQGVQLQYFTLVELCDFQENFYQRIKRGEGNLDVLRYPATQVNIMIDSKGKQYYEGTNFTLNKNGNIKWKTNKGPATGIIYSVNYDTLIRYRAIKADHSNRFAQNRANGEVEMVKMNEAWTLEKEYLAARIDEDGTPLPPNKIRDSDED